VGHCEQRGLPAIDPHAATKGSDGVKPCWRCLEEETSGPVLTVLKDVCLCGWSLRCWSALTAAKHHDSEHMEIGAIGIIFNHNNKSTRRRKEKK
jgi:hypothetical protein